MTTRPAEEYNKHVVEAQRVLLAKLDYSAADPELRELMKVKVHAALEALKMPESSR